MRVYLRVPAPRNSIHFHFHVVYTEPRASVRRTVRGAFASYQQDHASGYVPTRWMRAGMRARYHFINHARSQPVAVPRGPLRMHGNNDNMTYEDAGNIFRAYITNLSALSPPIVLFSYTCSIKLIV